MSNKLPDSLLDVSGFYGGFIITNFPRHSSYNNSRWVASLHNLHGLPSTRRQSSDIKKLYFKHVFGKNIVYFSGMYLKYNFNRFIFLIRVELYFGVSLHASAEPTPWERDFSSKWKWMDVLKKNIFLLDSIEEHL